MVEKLQKFELSNWMQLLLAAVVFFGGIWGQQKAIDQKLESFMVLRTVILAKHEEAQLSHEQVDNDRFKRVEERLERIESWRLSMAEGKR